MVEEVAIGYLEVRRMWQDVAICTSVLSVFEALAVQWVFFSGLCRIGSFLLADAACTTEVFCASHWLAEYTFCLWLLHNYRDSDRTISRLWKGDCDLFLVQVWLKEALFTFFWSKHWLYLLSHNVYCLVCASVFSPALSLCTSLAPLQLFCLFIELPLFISFFLSWSFYIIVHPHVSWSPLFSIIFSVSCALFQPLCISALYF